MNEQPLPAELSRFSNLADLAFRGSGEWSAACPHCGGADRARRSKSDRFRLFAASSTHNARVWCRRCGHFEWADKGEPPDLEQVLRTKKLQATLAQQEEMRLHAKIEALQRAAYWRGWFDAMTQQQRHLWHEQGVIDYMIDYYKLGYCEDYAYGHGGDTHHSPTMTIPHYGDDWQVVNIQHRLMQPVAGAGKYRQMKGLPAAMFRTEPGETLKGPVLVVEGAKKAIVTYTHLGTQPLGQNMQTIAVTSKAPSQGMLEQLSECEPVYLALDPDAYVSDGKAPPAINRVASRLGRERVKVVKLPCKPDDLLTIYGGDADDLRGFMRMAVSA